MTVFKSFSLINPTQWLTGRCLPPKGNFQYA